MNSLPRLRKQAAAEIEKKRAPSTRGMAKPDGGSSFIAGHSYDGDKRELTIQFKNGSRHKFDGVPLEKYAAFTGAASPGGFFNSKIKDSYPGRKIS